MIDSPMVRGHVSAVDKKGARTQDCGRSRVSFTSKVNARCDTSVLSFESMLNLHCSPAMAEVLRQRDLGRVRSRLYPA